MTPSDSERTSLYTLYTRSISVDTVRTVTEENHDAGKVIGP